MTVNTSFRRYWPFKRSRHGVSRLLRGMSATMNWNDVARCLDCGHVYDPSNETMVEFHRNHEKEM